MMVLVHQSLVKAESKELIQQWFVYLVQCRDNSLYCGITTDPERRENEHNTSKSRGAKYTLHRRPVKMVWKKSVNSINEALREERRMKCLPRTMKLKIIAGTEEF